MGNAWSWNRLYSRLESALSDERHMLYALLIGTCIALFFMFRSSKERTS